MCILGNFVVLSTEDLKFLNAIPEICKICASPDDEKYFVPATDAD